ncbi:MAG: HAD family hydrolase [Pirellulales bacterium]|nr:HAD family hydrolase [Pirellulales bacterium]
MNRMQNQSNLESDYRRVVEPTGPIRYLSGTTIEILGSFPIGFVPKHALFDFDGTLSLIREGWVHVMVPMMVDILLETGTDESPDDLFWIVEKYVAELTGQQTIYQMIRLAEEVSRRGGRPADPLEYKKEYHRRLMERIRSRREDLRQGRVDPVEMLVPGSMQLLDNLRSKNVKLYLASGTDEVYVREEAELLKIDTFFGEHIYGAVDDYRSFSKAQVIQRILANQSVQARKLIGFGDGYVEIQNVKEAGGIAVGVASDEANRSGRPDPWKRERLIGIGADFIVPDFREQMQLVDFLWNDIQDDGTSTTGPLRDTTGTARETGEQEID